MTISAHGTKVNRRSDWTGDEIRKTKVRRLFDVLSKSQRAAHGIPHPSIHPSIQAAIPTTFCLLRSFIRSLLLLRPPPPRPSAAADVRVHSRLPPLSPSLRRRRRRRRRRAATWFCYGPRLLPPLSIRGHWVWILSALTISLPWLERALPRLPHSSPPRLFCLFAPSRRPSALMATQNRTILSVGGGGGGGVGAKPSRPSSRGEPGGSDQQKPRAPSWSADRLVAAPSARPPVLRPRQRWQRRTKPKSARARASVGSTCAFAS